MNTALENIFRTDFMPHGHCYLWKPEILWLNVVSDVLIALAYFSIPGALYYFVLKRDDVRFRGVFVLFSLFIALCGVTHLISIVVIWNGAYGIHGLSKLFTAIVSCMTAVVVYKSLPMALRLPTQSQVHKAYKEAHDEKLKNVELQYQKYQDQILKDSANAANFGVMVLKVDGTISLANESAARMFSATISDIEGSRLEHFINYDCDFDPIQKVREAHSGAEKLVIEGQAIKSIEQSQALPLELSFTLHASKDESLIYVSVLDISIRKLAEQTLKSKQEFMSRIIDASLTGKYIITSDGFGFEFINSSFSQMTGYEADYLSSIASFSILDLCADKDRGRVKQQLEKMLRVDDDLVTEFEFQLLNSDGKTMNVLSKNTVFERSDNRQVSKIIGSVMDISSLKEAQQKAIKLKNEAEKANAIKSEFLANMSHEIRTPMNAIMGLTTLLAERDLPVADLEYVRKIKSSTHSLLNILNDILDYSKMEAGKLSVVNEPFRLNQIVEDVTGLFSVTAEQKELELVIDFPYAHDPIFIEDAMRISQVLSNLVGNAIKFTEAGFVKIKIEIQEHAKPQHSAEVTFEVQDTGIGISEQGQQELFNSFTQADTSINRQFGGTGLGLTISNGLLQLMDSKLNVKSAVGKGSTFSFSLNLDISERVITPVFYENYKTLIVDDNAENRLALGRVLDSWNFSNDQASSAKDALALLDQSIQNGKPYNLILVDWKMPEMDGISFITEIQSQHNYREALKGAVILLITGFARDLNQEILEQVAIDAVVEKPFVASRLYDTIASLSGTGEIRLSPSMGGNSDSLTRKQFADAKVLLVEDNETNQLVAREFLGKFGITPMVACDGQEAVEQFAENSDIDLILMDLQMPRLDGYSATKKIRKMASGTSIPIVAMSAAVMRSDLKKVEKAGLNAHIPKPIELNRLESILSQYLKPSGDIFISDKSHEAAPDKIADNQRLNITEALSRVGNDKSLLQELIRSTCRVQAQAPENLQKYFNDKSWDELQRLVHTLASGFKMVGAMTASELAYAVETDMLAEKPLNDISPLVKEVKTDLEALQSWLSATEKETQQITQEQPDIDISAQEVLTLLLETYQARQRIKTAQLKQYLLVLKRHFEHQQVQALQDDIERYRFADACEKLKAFRAQL